MPDKSIKDLEFELLQYEQGYAFGDVEKAEYERAKSSIQKQIAAKELVLTKQRAGNAVDKLLKNGEIDRKAHAETIRLIAKAKSPADIECIEFKAAA